MDNRRTFLYCMLLFEDGVTQEGARAHDWKSASKAVGCQGGKSPWQGRELTGRQSFGSAGIEWTTLSRKASNEKACTRTKTDTGRRGENPTVRGRTLVKELGKMHP